MICTCSCDCCTGRTHHGAAAAVPQAPTEKALETPAPQAPAASPAKLVPPLRVAEAIAATTAADAETAKLLAESAPDHAYEEEEQQPQGPWMTEYQRNFRIPDSKEFIDNNRPPAGVVVQGRLARVRKNLAKVDPEWASR
jgi:hypothetical protein